MAGSAAAAAVGTARGTEIGAKNAAVAQAQRAAIAKIQSEQRQQQEKDLVKQLVQQYDTDGSGCFDKDEITQVLASFSASFIEEELAPSDDDISFLLWLVDQEGGTKKGDGVFKKREIIAVVDIWTAYLERLELVRSLLQGFDMNQSGKIEIDELPFMLQSLDRGKPVPEDVVEWIFNAAGITHCEGLSGMEVARATVCFYRWLDRTDPLGDARRLKGYIKMPQTLTKPKPDGCCALM